jgi:DNA integrity scanning protein DisA with diadenylate cyclase activity/mannitol/fructose-specific phosphotransferase system IIA component (Ntr-type)
MHDAGSWSIPADRIIVVHGNDKHQLFSTLAEQVAGALPDPALSADEVRDLLWQREELLSTRLGTHVALPHAQVREAGETVVVIALCPEGIEYDARADEPVHLAVCVVGTEANHLDVLSSIATTLQKHGVLDALIAAARNGDREAARQTLADQTAAAAEPELPATTRSTADPRSATVWMHALALARDVGARCILLHVRNADAERYPVTEAFEGEVFVLTPDDLGLADRSGARAGGPSVGGLSVALLYALTEQRIRSTDVVVNVFGSRDPRTLDTVQVVDVEAAFRLFFSVSRELSLEASTHRVMLRVVEIAAELASEGREGKPVGALFVLGDLENVQPHCQQMLINPFKGYEASQRNVLDPGLTETVKELSRIDGAFVITDDGVLQSAGTYLRVDVDLPDLPPGLGARHAAAASITAVSEAVAVAISESTRQVSIFRHGKRVVVL